MNRYHLFTLLVLTSFLLTSCEVVGDIFEAGVWVGILAVVLVIGLLFYLFRSKK